MLTVAHGTTCICLAHRRVPGIARLCERAAWRDSLLRCSLAYPLESPMHRRTLAQAFPAAFAFAAPSSPPRRPPSPRCPESHRRSSRRRLWTPSRRARRPGPVQARARGENRGLRRHRTGSRSASPSASVNACFEGTVSTSPEVRATSVRHTAPGRAAEQAPRGSEVTLRAIRATSSRRAPPPAPGPSPCRRGTGRRRRCRAAAGSFAPAADSPSRCLGRDVHAVRDVGVQHLDAVAARAASTPAGHDVRQPEALAGARVDAPERDATDAAGRRRRHSIRHRLDEARGAPRRRRASGCGTNRDRRPDGGG